MPTKGKGRRYDSSGRRAAAAATRSAILAVARAEFTDRGYNATTMAQIARKSNVSIDTLYTVIGTKAELFRELIEAALSGGDEAVPGKDRPYVQQMIATSDSAEKLAIYATAVMHIQQRLAPLFLILRHAAEADAELGELWASITDRRAENMRLLADDLIDTGAIRPDLGREEVADIVWSMNGSEYYASLVLERGWDPGRFAEWLRDCWTRSLLA